MTPDTKTPGERIAEIDAKLLTNMDYTSTLLHQRDEAHKAAIAAAVKERDEKIAELTDCIESVNRGLGGHPDDRLEDYAQVISDIRDEGRAHFHSFTNMSRALASANAKIVELEKTLEAKMKLNIGTHPASPPPIKVGDRRIFCLTKQPVKVVRPMGGEKGWWIIKHDDGSEGPMMAEYIKELAPPEQATEAKGDYLDKMADEFIGTQAETKAAFDSVLQQAHETAGASLNSKEGLAQKTELRDAPASEPSAEAREIAKVIWDDHENYTFEDGVTLAAQRGIELERARIAKAVENLAVHAITTLGGGSMTRFIHLQDALAVITGHRQTYATEQLPPPEPPPEPTPEELGRMARDMHLNGNDNNVVALALFARGREYERSLGGGK